MSAVFTDYVLGLLFLSTMVLLGLASFFALFTLILRMKNERDERRWEAASERWEPILLEVLTEQVHPSALHAHVQSNDEILFLEFVLRYAQRLKSTERDLLREAVAPYLHILRSRLKHRRIGIRARAVQTLGTLGLPEYSEEVKQAIQDPSPYVAAIAARHLAHEIGADIAPDLCAALDRFRDFRTWYLVDMVVAMGPAAIPSLRRTLSDPGFPTRSRAVVAHALSVLRDLGSADLAANIAVGERDPAFLASLLRLLARVGTNRHAISARENLDAPEFFVRAAATRTLAELGDEDDLPSMVEMLSDPSSWVKMAAAQGVYRLGGKETLKVFAKRDDPAGPWFRQVLAEESSG